ncbi:hypothetical protein [Roseitranquillus sediminis]|uniref:hypothetical protein n=1 Tax=Roseitranquillus sediminis TaxID=2809051 RepID=UPI001D0C0C1B|nr:hypothetical protein [Roseitranquillus sediminis]MBM9594660.1 hypothetical protein [Roseitranquillus sediminis]
MAYLMLDWLSNQEALVIAVLALFGAGGAGTLIVRQLIGGKSDDRGGIRTEASGGSAAVTSIGNGNVDVRLNETVSTDRFEEWRTRLGLSRTATARLVRAMDAAQLSPDRVDALTADLRTESDGGAWDALAEALESDDPAAARVELQALDARLRRKGRGA